MSDLYRLLDQAIKLHGSGNLAGAEQIYTAILSTDPSSFTALHHLGILRAQQGRNNEALSLIGAAIRANPRSASARTNHGNVLMALSRHDEALASYEQALLLQPDVDTMANKATALQALGRFEQAVSTHDAVLAARPDSAQAWNDRGRALQELERDAEALASYDRAMALKPDDARIRTNRSITLWSMGDFAQALAGVDRAVELDPRSATIWSHRGNVLRALDRPEEALQCFDRAIALDGNEAAVYLDKCYCLLLAGRWREGWPLFEWRKRLPVPVEARTFAQPLWTGREDLSGKTLFCYVGQGLGDTIQFFRYCALAKARGARVILAPQNGLRRLLENSPFGIELIAQDEMPVQFDYHIPLMSFPLAFDTGVESIPDPGPYLAAEPEKTEEWRGKIGAQGLKIGVAWRGNDRGAMRGRSFPPTLLAELAAVPGVRLISLQKNASEAEARSILPAMGVESLGEGFDSGPDAFIDTAAVMQCLDLVVTADTSIAHLAGALGRPTWIALKHLPDWRWLLNRADSPWYRSVTLFRQPSEGDWQAVFRQMAQMLGARN